MKNLDELKLIIPDWNSLSIQYKENIEKTNSGGIRYDYLYYELSEIEAKRFVARLCLIQIAEYLEIKPNKFISSYIEGNHDLYEVLADSVSIAKWIRKNHPEILDWYFA